MMVSYWVQLLHLIYVRCAAKLPAGGIEMRQAASIQGDPGRSPVSACRPRPWWACSHAEVIHDVTAVSCRWRMDRGPKKSRSVIFFFFFVCTCLLSNQKHRDLAHCSDFKKKKKKKVFYCCHVFCMTEGLHGCWASFPVGLIPTHRRQPKCDVLFFLGILKWMWCLISFWFISSVLIETSNLAKALMGRPEVCGHPN